MHSNVQIVMHSNVQIVMHSNAQIDSGDVALDTQL